MRNAWIMAVGAAGFETAGAENGRDLLRIVRATAPPFILVLDLGMRLVSGAAIVAEMQRVGIAEEIPLVIVGTRRPFVGHSSIRFLSSPVPPETIVEEVRALEGKARDSVDWQNLLRELIVQVAGGASVVEVAGRGRLP